MIAEPHAQSCPKICSARAAYHRRAVQEWSSLVTRPSSSTTWPTTPRQHRPPQLRCTPHVERKSSLASRHHRKPAKSRQQTPFHTGWSQRSDPPRQRRKHCRQTARQPGTNPFGSSTGRSHTWNSEHLPISFPRSPLDQLHRKPTRASTTGKGDYTGPPSATGHQPDPTSTAAMRNKHANNATQKIAEFLDLKRLRPP